MDCNDVTGHFFLTLHHHSTECTGVEKWATEVRKIKLKSLQLGRFFTPLVKDSSEVRENVRVWSKCGDRCCWKQSAMNSLKVTLHLTWTGCKMMTKGCSKNINGWRLQSSSASVAVLVSESCQLLETKVFMFNIAGDIFLVLYRTQNQKTVSLIILRGL